MPTAATDSPIHLSGELTFAVTRKLYEQLNTQLRAQLQSSKTLRIDLSDVREVDSAGLALLVHCANLAAQHQAACIFTNPSPLRQMAGTIRTKRALRIGGKSSTLSQQMTGTIQNRCPLIFTNPSTQLRQMASLADLDELFHEQPQ